MHRIIGLDFETYAVTDLLECGLDNYVNCEFFTVLLAAVAVETDKGDIVSEVIDFRQNYGAARERLASYLGSADLIAAHNAGFEQAVLERLLMPQPASRFLDTAVMARAAGAAGKLEAAAPQLLGVDKVETGYDLIKLFSIPGEYQARSVRGEFDDKIVEDNPDKWAEFKYYCSVDAELSLRLAALLERDFTQKERENCAVTMNMNTAGWHVDMDLVEQMQARYDHNVEEAIHSFRVNCEEPDLNLSSFPQLQAWCAERGVHIKSFDELSVKTWIDKLKPKLEAEVRKGTSTERMTALTQVLNLLMIKQVIGGSSLKKLLTIENRVGADDRLRDSYLHIGAGATFRTSGRGVQMQNLPRLYGGGDDVSEVNSWSNHTMAHNLRQVFTAAHSKGRLIVGDFSAVESRGLAWLAGEDWKLQAYIDGRGVYEELAANQFNIPVESVDKSQRTFGKVGELSCGYGAGSGAVQTFAEKMGVPLTEDQAKDVVYGWRDACPKTVILWDNLNTAIRQAALGNTTRVQLPYGSLEFTPFPAPKSLQDQVGALTSTSVRIELFVNGLAGAYVSRVIHGLYRRGKNICYFKPSERKTGNLWSDSFTNPKTKASQYYSLYGGKLAGLLTQSLCRELFFDTLRKVEAYVSKHDNLKLVGQFHDEVVVEWAPQIGKPDLPEVERKLTELMSHTVLPGFPLTAEIKSAFRYVK